MEINPREKKLLIALGVIVVVVGIDFILNSDEYLGFYGKSNTQTVIHQKEKNTHIPLAGQVKKTGQRTLSIKDWGHDPFHDQTVKTYRRKKRVKVVTPDVKLELKAISVAQNLTVAMINSKVVASGDMIEGYLVKEITSKKVVLEKAGEQKILNLP